MRDTFNHHFPFFLSPVYFCRVHRREEGEEEGGGGRGAVSLSVSPFTAPLLN